MTKLACWAPCAALVVSALAFSTPASASPDASSTGLGAIDSHTAHELALDIGCRSPKVRRYYRRTLRSIDQRRWGQVRAALREDTVDLLGDAVYHAAKSGAVDGDVLARFLADAHASGTCSQQERDRTASYLAAADREHDPTDLDKCAGEALDARKGDAACALALGLRASFEGEVDGARASVTDLVTSLALPQITRGLALSPKQVDSMYGRLAIAFRGIVLSPESVETIDESIEDAFRGLEIDTVDPTRCTDVPLAHELVADHDDAQALLCAATRAKFDLSEVKIAVKAPSGTHEVPLSKLLHGAHSSARAGAAPGSGEHVLDKDEHLVEELLCIIPPKAGTKPAFDCSSGRLVVTRDALLNVALGTSTWTVELSKGKPLTVSTPGHQDLADVVATATHVHHLRQEVIVLSEQHLVDGAPKDAELRSILTALLRARRVAIALDAAPLDSHELVDFDATIDALPELTLTEHREPVCGPNAQGVDRVRCLADEDGALHSILGAAEGGHVRYVALRAASLVSPPEHGDRCATSTSAGRLLSAFAGYVSDVQSVHLAPEENDPLSASQLRATADEIRSCHGVDGVDGATRNEGPLGTSLDLVPSPALRTSWNAAYVNAFGSDGLRVAPSVDALIARVRLTSKGASTYVGLQASLVDLAAPFTELAMRRGDIRYERGTRVWLELLRPRLEVTMSIPGVSHHVLLSAGVSLRTAAPFAVAPASPTAAPSSGATYLTPFSNDSRAKDGLGNFVEYSLGVKYVL